MTGQAERSAARKQGPASAAPRGPAPALGYGKPRTYEDLRAVLSSGTIHFPKRLRQVAIFLWQHPNDVALGTISEVARKAGVQPSTLVRFAQIFGYSGFSDFQTLFKDHLRGIGRPAGGQERPQSPSRHVIAGLVAASQTSLARLLDTLDGAAFDRMAGTLAEADTIYVVGSKRAFPVASYVALAFSQQGVRSVLVDNVGSTALDQMSCVDRRCAVLAISFSPYNSITPELAAIAREGGAKIVSITDSTFSPLIELSDASVEVVEGDFAGVRSLAASLVVGMALVHAVVAGRSGD